MALIRPFRALRPLPDKAHQVAAVPYDVVSREEAAKLAEGNSLSFLHVSRPEIDLPQERNIYSDAVYARARKNFSLLTQQAPLIRETEVTLYIYRLKMGEHMQTGIVGVFSIDEYDQEKIKKHERTRRDKEDDRTRHLISLRAQTGPVFLTYRDHPAVAPIAAQTIEAQPPLFDFLGSDGVHHQIWKCENSSDLVRAYTKIPFLYIADGHHRAASASRARATLRSANSRHTGQEDYNYFLAVAFPASQLRILPYHRILKDWHGNNQNTLLRKLEERFELTLDGMPSPKRGSFSLFLGEKWIGMKPKFAPPSDPIRALDVSILQDSVLGPVFGIQDPRTDQRIDFVGGIRGTAELEMLVRAGRAVAAFSLHPTTLEDLFQVSDQGGIMPPKSTWFEPKLRDGLLSHTFEEQKP